MVTNFAMTNPYHPGNICKKILFQSNHSGSILEALRFFSPLLPGLSFPFTMLLGAGWTLDNVYRHTNKQERQTETDKHRDSR